VIPKTRAEALAGGYKKYATGTPCIQGHVADRRAKTGECLSCRADFLVKWRNKNKDKVKQHNATQYVNHTQKIKAGVKAWAKNNPVKILAHTRSQQTKRLMRLPKWLTEDDHWAIEQAYELAALRTKMFGFSWHVDHILPLQGKTVSGLHAPTNLQVIPGVENVRKGNRV
jgi:2,4-dienoyl-CoA reductase-like NADH-dependent reductase (Old Yellow Enzyme family)